MLSAACLAGCGGDDKIWVTGVLQKGGQTYSPPDGHKLTLHFCPMRDGSSGKPTGDVEMADYNPKDGSFTVPGRDGSGILPGRYRIAIVETLSREALDKLREASTKKTGQKRISRDTNFLEASYGEDTSPFIQDLKTSTSLTIDMEKPPA